MNRRPGKLSRRRDCGITLVEVLVGSTLLATVLVSVLLANGRLAVQSGSARNQRQACEVLNHLMEQAWPTRKASLCEGSGDVPGRDGWTWRVRTIENDQAQQLNSEVRVVEVFAPASADGRVAARVDILLPLVEEDANATQSTTQSATRPDAR